ncbi:RagB/SusD family nutrient uptake outer membrane protein [Mucilaginibacter terrae]|uniref:RagB/SusD family nutrient uptake outer membrane protein n=1 Tax=Mucilaginibacter terrae TaxID=1955052 RepID=UPI003638035C
MNKILRLFFLLTTVVLYFSSCQKFLEIEPKSDPTTASYYKTADDIRNAINGSYASLQGRNQYMQHFITLMETRSDNVSDNNSGGNAGRDYNIDRFIAGSDNVVYLEAWQSIYNAIYRCNLALANLDVVTNTAQRNQYEGELRFLRALNYFNAVRLWGNIPLTLTPVSPEESYSLIRNNQAEVYIAIETDLRLAAANLPLNFTGADLGRATQGSAKALLGKVYLTEKKFVEASGVLQEVISSKQYDLLPNVADVFSSANKMNKEIVFAVRYNKSVVDEGHPVLTYFDGPVLDPALLNAYQSGDARRDLLNTVASNSRNPVKKYFDSFDLNTNNVGNDFPLLRYADVLLMCAEALNEQGYSSTGLAITYLNQVRIRAKATEFITANLPDQGSFRNAVYQERRLELPLECQRWFDLVRTNTAAQAMQAVSLTIQPWQYLYPIPLTEVQIVNNPQTFPQNPNY